MASNDQNKRRKIVLLLLANLIGLTLKILVSGLGHTFDFNSYLIVSDLVRSGQNVYSETDRYNYGPVWFLILATLRTIWLEPIKFQLALVLILALSDTIISFIFSREVSLKAALIFALNPISIIISGYYLQFDTIAILLGILSILLYSSFTDKRSSRSYIGSGLIMGLSLCTKHLLIFLPACLVLNDWKNGKKIKPSLINAIISYSIFLFSFLPFVNEKTLPLIIKNVFLYQSVHNVGLIKGVFQYFSNEFAFISFAYIAILFAGALLVAILSFRSKPLEFFSRHLAIVFCLLSGMAPQYLIYILPLWTNHLKNIYLGLALLIGTALLISISPGLQVEWLDHRFFRLALIQLLALAAMIEIGLDSKRDA